MIAQTNRALRAFGARLLATPRPAEASRAHDAFEALASLTEQLPDRAVAGFTTAEIARQAGAADHPANWTAPWRDGLFACGAAGLVEVPAGRPYRWRLTAFGRERAGL